MSAPDTNIHKETRRHRPALLGIGAAVLFGLLMFFAVGFEAAEDADAPAVVAPQGESGVTTDATGTIPGATEGSADTANPDVSVEEGAPAAQ
ncbi:hypothetical protein [Albirhodobacter sp. R86504]|jgi:multidrug efflux pump subunit AcrA (membrane-fusion protein)|uniref:hypothetical protein n=1 Tax=Albirhodobacter sp. R86504 TaxID=3093848 RepID=UPI00366D2B14